ncbi:MAG: DUF433 domain-containing protein [Verrucomicrobiota bacterium]
MNASNTIELGSIIASTPGVLGGQPVVAGTRVSVLRIAGYHRMGMDAESIVAQLPHLSMAQVHAALAHYFAHRAGFDQELEAEECLFALGTEDLEEVKQPLPTR